MRFGCAPYLAAFELLFAWPTPDTIEGTADFVLQHYGGPPALYDRLIGGSRVIHSRL